MSQRPAINSWLLAPVVVIAVIGHAAAQDLDGDGVTDLVDICNNTPPGPAVDYWGRPYADFDQDCDVDLADFAFLADSLTGPMPRYGGGSPRGDSDGDGVDDDRDVCNNTPADTIVDYWGRPYSDFNHDCSVDLHDFAFLQFQFTGELFTCAEGQPCDDGIACTISDVCLAGRCKGIPVNERCDDALFCNGAESCDERTGCIAGSPVDCSPLDDDCHLGRCDEALDACVAAPAHEGDACDDGAFCTTAETCEAGVCRGGAATDCTHLDDDCNIGLCDEQRDACVASPAHEGEACDDGRFCTVGETCAAGACGSAMPMDCSALDDQCNVGVCHEDEDACEREPAHEGAACDDGLFCTTGETCSAGTCGGGDTVDCSDLDDACRFGVCDEDTDRCEVAFVSNGTLCSDGSLCTIADACDDGDCVGVALPDRLECDDGDPSTHHSICVSGDCLEGVFYEPSALITYSCPIGGIIFSVTTVELADNGEILTVFGAPAVMRGPGGLGPDSAFSVSGSTTLGSCTKTFILDGQFSGGPNFVGTFRAQFIGCGSCAWPSWPGLLFTRQ